MGCLGEEEGQESRRSHAGVYKVGTRLCSVEGRACEIIMTGMNDDAVVS